MPARRAKLIRMVKVTTGVALLPVGVAMLVLPGPGIPVVLGSVALLKDEFGWAKSTWAGVMHAARRSRAWLQERAAR